MSIVKNNGLNSLMVIVAMGVVGLHGCSSSEQTQTQTENLEAQTQTPLKTNDDHSTTVNTKPEISNKTAKEASAPVQGGLSSNHPNTLDAPNLNSLGEGEQADNIRYGRLLVVNTYNEMPNHVGNKLNCTSCHLNEGRVAHAAPFIGMNVVYPKYRSRNDKINTLEDRVNGCFQRSMNGKPLESNAREMQAIIAYINWLSQDVKSKDDLKGTGFIKINKDLEPNADNGKALFTKHCVSCHQTDGAGLYPSDRYMFPAVAGQNSFNDGAGMARTYTAAAFIKANMPLGQEGTLTEQEAVDIGYYVSHMPRPSFPGKANDWPKGNAPKDARH